MANTRAVVVPITTLGRQNTFFPLTISLRKRYSHYLEATMMKLLCQQEELNQEVKIFAEQCSLGFQAG